jgi:recombination associated protein RdgC
MPPFSSQQARECGSLELSTIGWDRPLGRSAEMLTHAASGRIMICARRSEKVLPAAVVREQLAVKIEEIEEAEGRKVRRREQLEIKDQLVDKLLPQAFSKSSRVYAYIDPKDGWLVVDAASAKRSEELVTLLRESLGSLPLRPVVTSRSPASVMTAWLERGEAGPFLVQDECELREPTEGGGVIRCRHQDLEGDEINAHLEAGKQAVRLALEWEERIGFVVAEDLSVKRLRFLDLIQEEAAEVETDDDAARFDADFAIMTGELGRFIPSLIEQFGGLEEEG